MSDQGGEVFRISASVPLPGQSSLDIEVSGVGLERGEEVAAKLAALLARLSPGSQPLNHVQELLDRTGG